MIRLKEPILNTEATKNNRRCKQSNEWMEALIDSIVY